MEATTAQTPPPPGSTNTQTHAASSCTKLLPGLHLESFSCVSAGSLVWPPQPPHSSSGGAVLNPKSAIIHTTPCTLPRVRVCNSLLIRIHLALWYYNGMSDFSVQGAPGTINLALGTPLMQALSYRVSKGKQGKFGLVSCLHATSMQCVEVMQLIFNVLY